MTANTYEFGDTIRFVNAYGQDAVGTVISQDGDWLAIDYLGVGRTLDLTAMSLDDDPADEATTLAAVFGGLPLADAVDLALVMARAATDTGHTTPLGDVLTAYGLTPDDLETGGDPR